MNLLVKKFIIHNVRLNKMIVIKCLVHTEVMAAMAFENMQLPYFVIYQISSGLYCILLITDIHEFHS